MNTNAALLPQVITRPRSSRDGNTKVSGLRPRLVVAHPDVAYVDAAQRHFRRLGWEVFTATSGEEVRRLAGLLNPDAVILATLLAGESGWLTCTKLLCDHSDLKVILVGADRSASAHEFAAFVGAARLVSEVDGVAVLVEEAYDMALAAAG